MPPPSSRMTKNRAQPTRYRPGKAEAEDPESEEESSEEEDDDERPAAAARAPPPKATTFPKKLAVDMSKAGQQTSKPAAPQAKPPDADLEGFETASETSEEEGSGSNSGSDEDSSEEEDSSSDDEPAKPMLRPTFISKARRAQQQSSTGTPPGPTAEEKAAMDEKLRKEKADALLQMQLDRDAAARAAGKKYWDDDDIAPEDEVDDTDDLDEAAELAAWKLRELKRVRRERAAIEEKEKEREEVERRRNLTAEEREEEDRQFLAAQKERGEERGKMGFMQKYFHKGAFFGADGGGEEQDEEVKAALNRDLAGARFEDDAGDKSLLPEYMRVRDMTRLGRKGRSKYKDLKSEDTGRWGAEVGRKKREFGDVQDERFRPDDERGGGGREGPTGANSAALGERKRARYE